MTSPSSVSGSTSSSASVSTATSPEHHANDAPKTRSHVTAKDRENFPLYSRIFVVCPKSFGEQDLHEMFSKFGEIENVRLLRERHSNHFKGFSYIKFAKASSAALAIEAMDGVQIDQGAPFKVQIAEVKGNQARTYGEDPEDTPARSRLFVVCPRDMTEDVLYEEFQQYGNLQYCKVMTNRATNESKGYAYVKFGLASNAALALEKISEHGTIASKKVKVLVADPKCRRTFSPEFAPDSHINHLDADGGAFDLAGDVSGYDGYPMNPEMMYGSHYPQMPAPFMAQQQQPIRCLVRCAPGMAHAQLNLFLSQFYGFEYCTMQVDASGMTNGTAIACFANPHAAFMALETCANGVEFPRGSLLQLLMLDPFPYYSYPAVMPMPVPVAMPMSVPMPMSMPMSIMPTSPPSSTSSSASSASPSSHAPATVFYQSSKPLERYVLEDIFSRFGQIKRLYESSTGRSGSVVLVNAGQVQALMMRLSKVQVGEDKISFKFSLVPFSDEVSAPHVKSPHSPTENIENREVPKKSVQPQPLHQQFEQQLSLGRCSPVGDQRAPLSPLRLSVG